MYGGLFGDLPAAKGSKNDNDDSEGGKDEGGASKTDKSSAKTLQVPGDPKTKKKTNNTATNWLMPVARKSNKPKSSIAKDEGNSIKVSGSDGGGTRTVNSSASSSQQFFKTVGTAGTSMAFVPTAALKKRKKIGPTMTKPMPSSVRPRVADTGDGTTQAVSAPLASASLPQEGATARSGEAVPANFASSITSNIDDMPSTFQPAVFHPAKISDTNEHSSSKSNVNDLPKTFQAAVFPTTKTSDTNEYSQCQTEFTSSINDDVLEHSNTQEIEDPYDPSVPNDLLQYWERKALADQRKDLEREAREAMEQQEAIRKQIDKEREKLLEKGDYEQIIQQQERKGIGLGGVGQGRGRGRGRGVSNLPAWLLEKQRKEQGQQLGGGDNTHRPG